MRLNRTSYYLVLTSVLFADRIKRPCFRKTNPCAYSHKDEIIIQAFKEQLKHLEGKKRRMAIVSDVSPKSDYLIMKCICFLVALVKVVYLVHMLVLYLLSF